MEAKVTCAVLANDALAVDNLNDDAGSGHDHGEFHADMFTAWALQNIKKDKGRLDIMYIIGRSKEQIKNRGPSI